MSHTPGPWKVEGTQARHVIVGADGHQVASLCFNGKNYWPNPSHDAYPAGRAEGNAQLLAAAPDLLAACEAVERVTHGGDFPGPVYLSLEEVQALRAAIASTKEGGRMKLHKVTLTDSTTVTLTVQAEDNADARGKALDLWAMIAQPPFKQWAWRLVEEQDGKVEVVSVEGA